MIGNARAGKGSVAGASGDAGVEYRRAVAAYAVAHGLAGSPLLGVCVPVAHAHVRAVSLETEDAVDDLRVEFTSGWIAQIQAKRTLRKGSVLTKVVQQWVQAGQRDLDPDRDRLVVVAGSVSGSLRHLRSALDRGRLTDPGPPTDDEAAILEHVAELLADLSEPQRQRVLRCAVVWELPVEEIDQYGAQHAMQLLKSVIKSGAPVDARRAWESLLKVCGVTARLRGGRDLAGWHKALVGEGVVFGSDGASPAAELEVNHQALDRYRARLVYQGEHIDLRSLGAQIPPLSLIEADCNVKVNTGSRSDRESHELLWAFLSRGRTVLTGLPGGGKSTAIKRLAADLCSLPGAPLPVLASLRDINALPGTRTFRDRMIDIAIRHERSEDRIVLAGEIERRLHHGGGIALLLDALDETYDDRAGVVGEIEAMLADISPDVDVLLATRDVAYGHAETLGWLTLRVLPPRDTNRTVRAVLSGSSGATDEEWVVERVGWVNKALAKGRGLHETPLVPVLLAILAAERSIPALPARRAGILAAVVESVVARRELKRSDEKSLGPLSGSSMETAAMHAFAAEAKAILDNSGKISLRAAVDRIATELANQWGLPPGHARTAALEAVHFLDESGIFVLSGTDQTVVPRLALLAEIGDALWISAHEAQIEEWVERRLTGEQLEPLVLGAGLNTSVAAALDHLLVSHLGDRVVAEAAVRAVEDGAVFAEATTKSLCEALIRHVAIGTAEGWACWSMLIRLGLPPDLRLDAEEAAAKHGTVHAMVAKVGLDLLFASDETLTRSAGELLAVLDVPRLPARNAEQPGTAVALYNLTTADQFLVDTQIAVATALVGKAPAAAPKAARCARNGSQRLQDRLVEILRDRGFDELVDEIEDEQRRSLQDSRLPNLFSDFDVARETQLLTLLARRRQAVLSYSQSVRLKELSTLLNLFDLNAFPAMGLLGEPDEFLDGLVDLTVLLYGMSIEVLAAQAQLVRDRMDCRGDTDAYYALFDGQTEPREPDWTSVPDKEAAVEILLAMFRHGPGQAWFAARSLAGAPVADIATPQLRRLLPSLAARPKNQQWAASALSTLVDGPEPRIWLGDQDPVLRAVAARMTKCGPNDEGLLALLNDPDGHVRKAAIRRVNSLTPINIVEILAVAAGQAQPGWTCMNCRLVNAPPETACARCRVVGPDPAEIARELLAQRTLEQVSPVDSEHLRP
ncbi:hypothetical protein [Lentzea flaviverrucosa]|uniref:hypothetical protein n=1 Tax=Lentzea flaviverrucosa TaxID=200379 RepID=UPI0011606AAA|nr:hypothetical protein [Lentzea flaviverrucosa]